jgi:hypothetical protein
MNVFANNTVFTDNTDGCFLIKQPSTKLADGQSNTSSLAQTEVKNQAATDLSNTQLYL